MIQQRERVDFSTVPQSKGLDTGTKVILVVGLLMIFTIGGFSAFLSGYGHVWPSNHTLRYPLGKMPR